MLAVALCEAQPGERVCDVCAAPGGKATAIVEQLSGTGFLLANEVISSRTELLQLALCRSGWGNFCCTQADVAELSDRLGGTFDRVLVDAPCSGQSMVARDRQSMAAFSATQIGLNAERQRRILQAAARLVVPGGRLVYSTCTFSIAENELVVQDFLSRNPLWQLVELPSLAAWTSPFLPGCYRLWPHRDRCDGAFAAALQLHSDAQPQPSRPKPDFSPKETRWTEWTEPFAQLDFIREEQIRFAGYVPRFQNGSLHLFEQNIQAAVLQLAKSGLPMADLKHARWQPSYGSAVLREPFPVALQTIPLDDRDAVRFVAGQSVERTEHAASPSWGCANWNGRPLSWAKWVGNVLKNHFPKALRLQNVRAS
jgi:NOL1/NOP2/fmu family ribosome biogenesis protein